MTHTERFTVKMSNQNSANNSMKLQVLIHPHTGWGSKTFKNNFNKHTTSTAAIDDVKQASEEKDSCQLLTYRNILQENDFTEGQTAKSARFASFTNQS